MSQKLKIVIFLPDSKMTGQCEVEIAQKVRPSAHEEQIFLASGLTVDVLQLALQAVNHRLRRVVEQTQSEQPLVEGVRLNQ